jgi:serine/threonine protein kinase/Tfp pilus assembly protein PilF
MGKPPSTRVMEIFNEAATRAPGESSAYLERVCDGNQELRGEVESLLSMSRQSADFLRCPTSGGLESHTLSGAAVHDIESVECDGIMGGRYSIIERLGEGGWGVVYRARQNHPIRREVALKIAKLGTDSRPIIARFESERQAMAMMDHPNIARIFDAGTTDDGRPCFAMELLWGLPITEYCDARRLPVPRRLELFALVCQAVQHAHQKGIIHRDLKPSNILVAMVDGAPAPKVIDFGIAKAVDATLAGLEPTGEPRFFLGTPQYMSPEQLGYGKADIDTRSDIYSLGVLLYELLVGSPPQGRPTVGEATSAESRRTVAQQEPPRLRDWLWINAAASPEVARCRGVGGRTLARVVCGELQWVVERAMARDRSQRYETVAALRDDVLRYLANEPLLAAPPNSLYRMRKFARRRRGPLLAAFALVVALMLGLGGTILGLVRAQHDRQRAEISLAQAEQMSNFLAEMLNSADPDRARGKKVLVSDILDRTSRDLDRGSLKDQPLVEAGIRMTLGRSYDSLGLFPQSEAQVRKAMEIRQRVLGDNNRETAQSMIAVAWALHMRPDEDAADELTRKALAIEQKLLGERHRDVVSALINLGEILRAKGDHAGAVVAERRAADLSAQIPAGQGLRSIALTDLAVAEMSRGNFNSAEPLLREAIAIDRQLHGDRYRNVPRNLSNLAAIRKERGDLKGAKELWIEALGLQRQILPPDHPDIAWTLRLLGNIERAQGDLSGGESDLRRSLEMEKRVFGPSHPMVAILLGDLAPLLRDEGRRDEAASLSREALEIQLAHDTKSLADHPNGSTRRGAIVQLHLRLGEFAQAQSDLDEAMRAEPRRLSWATQQACTCLLEGDAAGYHDVCRRILNREFDLSDASSVARAIEVCLLEKPAETNMPRIADLTMLAAPARDVATAPLTAIGRGLFAFRAGRFPDAAEAFVRIRTAVETDSDRAAVGFYLAIALREMGKGAESAAALSAAEADFLRLPRVDDGDIGPDTDQWMICQIARREAHHALALDVATTHPAQ